MQELLNENWKFVLTVIILPLVTWFAGRKHLMYSNIKKSQAEVTEAELGNITSNFKVYQDLINDLERRFKVRIQELEEDIAKIKLLNEELRKQISSQEKYIKKQQEKIDNYEKLGR